MVERASMQRTKAKNGLPFNPSRSAWIRCEHSNNDKVLNINNKIINSMDKARMQISGLSVLPVAHEVSETSLILFPAGCPVQWPRGAFGNIRATFGQQLPEYYPLFCPFYLPLPCFSKLLQPFDIIKEFSFPTVTPSSLISSDHCNSTPLRILAKQGN